MGRALVWFCVAGLILAAATVGSDSSAQPSKQERNAARALAISGRKLYRAGDYETAIERFHSAEAIVHAPAHVLYLARAHAKLGRLVAARDLYQQIVDEPLGANDPAPFHRAQDKARREIEALAPRIPSVALTITGPSSEPITITLDDQPLPPGRVSSPVPVDPGEHRLAVTAPGWRTEQRSLSLAEGEAKTLTIALSRGDGPAVADPDGQDDGPGEPLPIGPIVLFGVGGAALIVGGVTGALALERSDELHDRCPPNPCPPENEALEDEAKVFATVSTVGFVLGGAAVAGGLAWWLFGSSDGEDELSRSWLRPLVGPTSLGIGGTF